MSKDTNITTLTSLEEYQVAIATGISIIKFSGSHCAPCNRISRPYELLADANTNVRFYQVEIGEVPQVTIKEQIPAIPAFIIYYNGARLSSYVGANEHKLSETLYTGLASIVNKKLLLTTAI